VRAGTPDCPVDNQALKAIADFRFETDLSIVFIFCWQLALKTKEHLSFKNTIIEIFKIFR
jgi:hypothetical protein